MGHSKGISAFPQPSIGDIFGKTGSFIDHCNEYTARFSSGRAAVYWAFRSLDLPYGSVAWLPEYHCGVEVQAALDAGLSVRYYRISRDLSVNEFDLERCLHEEPGPVLLIHYFGFTQPAMERIAQLCLDLRVTLIEDCAHALFSSVNSVPLGATAPIAVFSLRKTLPIYDGGALAINNALTEFTPSLVATNQAYVKVAKDAVRAVFGRHSAELIRSTFNSSKNNAPPPEWENQARSYCEGQSRISRQLSLTADPASIVNARRDNWLYVHQRLSEYSRHQPVWQFLEPGICPLFYCFWVSQRDHLMRRLLSEGIETFRFGARPHPTLDLSTFSDSSVLRDHVLGFPVHQNILSSELNAALGTALRILEETDCV